LFLQVRDAAVQQTAAIQRSAAAIAQLDVLGALAERALVLGYIRPKITEGDAIRIRDGRHPVVEQLAEAERFVPNDVLLDGTANQLIIITGPNMAASPPTSGRSRCWWSWRRWARYPGGGGGDRRRRPRLHARRRERRLARGRSTFMVEMQETANILHNATRAA